jgi:hypothetical protein
VEVKWDVNWKKQRNGKRIRRHHFFLDLLLRKDEAITETFALIGIIPRAKIKETRHILVLHIFNFHPRFA